MKKYLTDVLSFEECIKPYKIIQINAGVGAGKSTWVDSITNQRILLITSRAITANSQAEKFGAGRWITEDDIKLMKFRKRKGIIYKYIVTNAVIEKYAKEIYDVRNTETYLWDYFDLIILDEAHSLITDASFSSAPFHVYDFLYQAEHRGECRLVFMTGTPEPISDIFTQTTMDGELYIKYDFFDECVNVVPSKVILFPYCKIIGKLLDELRRGQKIIYFANTITGIKTIYDQLIAHGIDNRLVGVTFASSKTPKHSEFKERHKANAEGMQKYIRENERIPEEVQILLTTSVNREGVNIVDSNINVMYAESSEKTELIQMAGRVRTGIKELYILYGVPRNYKPKWEALEQDVDKKCVESVNAVAESYFEQYLDGSDHDKITINNVVEEIEEHFSYIRYSYFEHSFCYYAMKAQEKKSRDCDARLINNYIESWDEVDEFQRLLCEEESLQPGRELFQKWFPLSEVELVKINSDKNSLLNEVQQTLQGSNILDTEVSYQQLDYVIERIKEHIQKYDYRILNINPLLKQRARFFRQFGYSLKEVAGHRKGTLYLLTKDIKLKKE